MGELAFTPASKAQRERILDRLPRGVHVIPIDVDHPESGTVSAHVQPDGRTSYTLPLDLAGIWGFETNVEAREALEDELRVHPELRDRVAIDVESSAVWLHADSREDLAAVEAIVAAVSPAS